MMAPPAASKKAWWKEAIVYQVYPSSFKDSNGDGWGDVKGITSKLDYIKKLGVDIIWVSPIYKSPQADMGYDISDYKSIDPRYGTLEDVDELISELGKRDMKLMMDLVVNHTSEEHAWFLESRSSTSNPKRDWYIWKPPRGKDAEGKPLPPNNWAQILGDANSAWTYDEKTGEFYLSLFTPEQPDLNWENPDVRAAVHDLMEFWLVRGACGFRMDVINLISKDQRFPDAPPAYGPDAKYHPGIKYYANGPRMHEYLQEIHKKVLAPHNAVTVGEMPWISDIDEIMRTVGSDSGELSMIFIFDIVDIDNQPGQSRLSLQDFGTKDIARIQTKWQRAMLEKDGWNSVFIENHDNPRSVGRYVDDSDEWRERGAKLLALMQTTLAGTLFVYQGEELGMRNVPSSWDIETEYKDIESINFWKKYQALAKGDEKILAEGRHCLQRKARDHSRTPVQWNSGPNAGFCDEGVTPWMRVNDDYKECNAEAQMQGEIQDGESVWKFWRRGLMSRKAHKDVFVYGNYEVVQTGGEKVEGGSEQKVFAYFRTGIDKGDRWLVVLNFSGDKVSWALPDGVEAKWIIATYREGQDKEGKGTISLEPWEGLLGKCS